MTSPDGERLCGSCGEPNPVRAKFCLECGNALEAPDVELGERRTLSVLFADLSGFTAFSEGSDVEDVRTLAKEAADRLSEIVTKYGGTVDKIIGDCVMAYFGAPLAHEDDAERAVRAALDMQACVSPRSERFFGLALCVGINTGETIWSPIGPDGRYTVLGDTVNTAARLQGAATKGEVVVGAETYRASADAIAYEAMEPVKAKNKADPVEAWRAVDVKGARRKARDLPIIGRERELDRIWELWELARTERTPYLATLIGAPGIGKSRVIRAITERLGSNAFVLSGRALSFGDGITYWPVIEMVKQAAGIHHEETTDEASRKLGVFLEDLGSEDLDELRTMAVALANLIAAPTTPRGTYQATEITKGELHWGIRRVFQLLSRHKPLALIFEDLHWAEPAFTDLVLSFLDSPDDTPILMIGSGRPELALDEPKIVAPHKQARHLTLEQLSEDQSRAMAEALLGEAATDGALATLLERAAGNPLFVEETVRMLLSAGALTFNGKIDASTLAELTIPSSLRGLIEARLDRLSPVLKRTAGRASVLGESFWSGAVTFLDGADGDVDELLRALEEHDVVREAEESMITGQREWSFRHALIRDIAYERIPKTERARLHARCAEWISLGGSEYAEIVAHHLEQSCLLAKELSRTRVAPPVLDAARALSRAAEKAAAHDGAREAVGFFSRALNLLEDAYPETAVDVRLQYARNLTALGRYDEAYAEQGRVAEESVALARPDLQVMALLSQAETDVIMGRVTEAHAHVGEAEAAAHATGEHELKVRTAAQRAVLNELFDNAPNAAEENIRGALALAEEIEHAELTLTMQLRLGTLLFNIGKLGEAETALDRAIELAAEHGSLRHTSWITAILGYVRLHRGPRRRAAEDLARAAEWLERTDDRYMRIQALVWRANLELACGDVRKSILYLRTAMPLAREIGGPLVPLVCRSLVEALVRQDRIAEAREVAATAMQSADDEDPYARAHTLVAEAMVAVVDGDDTGVRQRFAIAHQLLESNPIVLGEMLIAEANALHAVGDAASAADRLEHARSIFNRVGGTATADDIERELLTLSDERPPAVIPLHRASSGA